jgi:hypothetical protein
MFLFPVDTTTNQMTEEKWMIGATFIYAEILEATL